MKPSTPPDGDRPRSRPDVVFRAVSDEWVLYDPRTQDLHVLNLTAAAVWSLCDGAHTPAEMARALSAELDAPPDPEQVLQDVHTTLARFRQDGLLA